MMSPVRATLFAFLGRVSTAHTRLGTVAVSTLQSIETSFQVQADSVDSTRGLTAGYTWIVHGHLASMQGEDSSLGPLQAWAGERAVRAVSLPCGISGSCERDTSVFRWEWHRQFLALPCPPHPCHPKPPSGEWAFVAMVTAGLAHPPIRHFWKRTGPWITRKSMSNSVRFQLPLT